MKSPLVSDRVAGAGLPVVGRAPRRPVAQCACGLEDRHTRQALALGALPTSLPARLPSRLPRAPAGSWGSWLLASGSWSRAQRYLRTACRL